MILICSVYLETCCVLFCHFLHLFYGLEAILLASVCRVVPCWHCLLPASLFDLLLVSLQISIRGHQAASHNLLTVFSFMLPASPMPRIFLVWCGFSSSSRTGPVTWIRLSHLRSSVGRIGGPVREMRAWVLSLSCCCDHPHPTPSLSK